MSEVTVSGRIPARVSDVWAVLRVFGDLAWGGIHGTVVEGDGIGCVRIFEATGGITIYERLEHIDEERHVLGYSIIDPSPVPWTDYRAEIALVAADDETDLRWTGRFEPRNITEAQADAIVRAIFENGIRNLTRATAAPHAKAAPGIAGNA